MVYRVLGGRDLSTVRRMKMFSNHVSKQLSAYWNGELPSENTRRTAEHLIRCTRCRLAFEEIKLGAKLAQHLPLIAAPDSIWPKIETALLQQPDALPIDHPTRDARVGTPVGRASDRLPLARYLKPGLAFAAGLALLFLAGALDRKSTRLNSSHVAISYAVFCL